MCKSLQKEYDIISTVELPMPRNISLNKETFKQNLHLMTSDNKYNIMAQLLSDNSHIPIRVAIFSGKNKASKGDDWVCKNQNHNDEPWV